jgi:hypothetical protein
MQPEHVVVDPHLIKLEKGLELLEHIKHDAAGDEFSN